MIITQTNWNLTLKAMSLGQEVQTEVSEYFAVNNASIYLKRKGVGVWHIERIKDKLGKWIKVKVTRIN